MIEIPGDLFTGLGGHLCVWKKKIPGVLKGENCIGVGAIPQV